MLIEYYSPQVHKTINNADLHSQLNPKDDQQTTDPNEIKMDYKSFRLPSLPLDYFDAYSVKDMEQLFDDQFNHVKKQAKLFEEYGLMNKESASITINQYKDLYVHQPQTQNSTSTTTTPTYVIHKWQLLDYLAKLHNKTTTYLSSLKPNEDTNKSIKHDTKGNPPLQTKQISIQAIRDITGFSTSPFVHILNRRIEIRWQEELLNLAHDLSNREIIVDGSRQMGKSKSTAQLLVESSFLPNFHQLVAAPLQELTNLIKNYIQDYTNYFDESTFIKKSKENYILNTFSGSRIHFKTLKDEGMRTLGLTLSRVIVDEWQLVDIPTVIDGLKPTMSTTSGQLIILGTAIADTSSYMYSSIMESKKWNDKIKVITVSLNENPVIPDDERQDILSALDNPTKAPSIMRQYFNKWGGDETALFIPNVIESYEYIPTATLIIANDPARKWDRSAFSINQVSHGKVITIRSWYIPDSHKSDWTMQRAYMSQLKNEYSTKYKKIITVMDVSGVGDGAVSIFEQGWYTVNYRIRYTAGDSFTIGDNNEIRVGKSALINNALDLIGEWIHQMYWPETVTLREEIDHIEVDFDKLGKVKMKSQYFDDESNAMMIAMFISTNLWVHLRPDTQSERTSISAFKKELEAYYWKTNSRPNRSANNSFYW